MNLTPDTNRPLPTESARVGTLTVEAGGYIDGEQDTVENGSLRVMELVADLIDAGVADHPDEITEPIRREAETLRFRLDNARGIEGEEEIYATVYEHLAEAAEDAIAVLNDHTEGGSFGWESGSFVLTVGDPCAYCAGLGCQSCGWTGVELPETDELCAPGDCEDCDHYRETGEEL